MQPRDRPIDLFSTFALLQDDRFQRWIIDPRLRQAMAQLISHAPDADERVWAGYWHQQWQTHPRAQAHLSAYLQEPCFWVAQDLTRRLQLGQYTMADYFQIANGEIHRVCKGFNPDRSNNIKTYAKLVLTSTLKDLLRQRQAADVCSDWALLRKISKKRVGEVLQDRGVLTSTAAEYQFAWFCFKTIYIPSDPNGQKLPPPTPIVWHQITQLYNHKYPALTAAQIETRLTKLAQWTRSYLYPSIDSLNRSKPETGEIIDDLTDANAQSLLDLAIESEEISQRLMQRSALQATLDRALQNLSPELQEIIQLCYGDRLSQQELADRLQLSQPTISRRIKQAEAGLLGALLQWIESQLHKFPDPIELTAISATLKEWLTEYVGKKG